MIIVKYDILKLKYKRVCLVNQWFRTNHNRDYVGKPAIYNNINLTKTMPKEETLFLFRKVNMRLQLVRLFTIPRYSYLIRLNRKHIYRTKSYDNARREFSRRVFDTCLDNTLF